MTKTLGAQFAARKTNGFDYLRIVLAGAVIAWHSITVSYGVHAGDALVRGTIWTPIVRSIMPIFFALSGFLVASSLERAPNLKVFISARVLRIFPALVVEVALSALILGPILTTVPLGEYFTGRQFFSYFANMLGWIHYFLPGVFLDNPDAGIVNRSLWTVPSELECYILLSALFLCGIFARRGVLTGVTVVCAVAALIFIDVPSNAAAVVVWTRLLPLSFLAGVMAWKWRDRLPAGPLWGVGALVLTVALMATVRTTPLGCFSAAYVAAALGCVDIPRNKILASGDYSYGMYLYAYPIQQLIVKLVGPGKPLLAFAGALVLIPAFAAFSWHAVEKHALKLKPKAKPSAPSAPADDAQPANTAEAARSTV